VGIILIGNAYKDGHKILALYVDIISSLQSLNFVNYAINAKDYGFA
jgi:hypothetical protein